MGLSIRAMHVQSLGFVYDVQAFAGWIVQLRYTPLWEFHSGAGYPPGYFVILFGLGRLYGALTAHTPDANGTLLRIFVKAPAILMDLVNAAILWWIVGRFLPKLALVAAALVLLNPAIIITSAYWGQIDSVCWGPALAAVALVIGGCEETRKTVPRFAWAWFALAASLMIKPQAAPLCVVLAVFVCSAPGAERRGRLQGSAIGVFAGLVLAWSLWALMAGSANPVVIVHRVLEEGAIAGHGTSFTSLNAFNFWSIAFPFFVPDSVRVVGGVTLATFGAIIAVSLVALIAIQLARVQDTRTFLEASMLAMFSVFLFATGMHERYVFGALLLSFALIGFGGRYLSYACALTVTATLNLIYALMFLWVITAKPSGIDVRNFAPALAHAGSVANVALFVVILFQYLRRTAAASPLSADRQLVREAEHE